jgi:hypothetical protein
MQFILMVATKMATLWLLLQPDDTTISSTQYCSLGLVFSPIFFHFFIDIMDSKRSCTQVLFTVIVHSAGSRARLQLCAPATFDAIKLLPIKATHVVS